MQSHRPAVPSFLEQFSLEALHKLFRNGRLTLPTINERLNIDTTILKRLMDLFETYRENLQYMTPEQAIAKFGRDNYSLVFNANSFLHYCEKNAIKKVEFNQLPSLVKELDNLQPEPPIVVPEKPAPVAETGFQIFPTQTFFNMHLGKPYWIYKNNGQPIADQDLGRIYTKNGTYYIDQQELWTGEEMRNFIFRFQVSFKNHKTTTQSQMETYFHVFESPSFFVYKDNGAPISDVAYRFCETHFTPEDPYRTKLYVGSREVISNVTFNNTIQKALSLNYDHVFDAVNHATNKREAALKLGLEHPELLDLYLKEKCQTDYIKLKLEISQLMLGLEDVQTNTTNTTSTTSTTSTATTHTVSTHNVEASAATTEEQDRVFSGSGTKRRFVDEGLAILDNLNEEENSTSLPVRVSERGLFKKPRIDELESFILSEGFIPSEGADADVQSEPVKKT